jgi:hypothetical protein
MRTKNTTNGPNGPLIYPILIICEAVMGLLFLCFVAIPEWLRVTKQLFF